MPDHLRAGGDEHGLPECLGQGERARLFPAVADTNRENRLTSVFLALLTRVPVLAKDLFATAGFRVGKRTRIECWTEVVPIHGEHLDKRPDGLIVASTGRVRWSAYVEAKIKKNKIDDEQVLNYMKAAKDAGLTAVITISNQFVARADQSPVKSRKHFPRKVDLFHWSWIYIKTRCEILARDLDEDTEQVFLLNEFLRLLGHKDTGVERFSAMNVDWRKLVQTVANQGALKKNSTEVEECVACWHQEERDLCLQLSLHVGETVQSVIVRALAANPIARLNHGSERLVSDKSLHSVFRIPNCAADLEVCAHLMARTVTYGMRINAPLDRKSTKARVNWLLRMLPDQVPNLVVRAHWPGRTEPTDQPVEILRKFPGAIQTEKHDAAPRSFEVLLIEHLGSDFYGRMKFIDRLEGAITQFYDHVGQHLRAWQAPPPRPVKPRDALIDQAEEGAVAENTVPPSVET